MPWRLLPHRYSLLQAENQRLESAARDHAQAAQSADNQAVADAQALAAKATAQLAGVSDALRQTQAQAAALAAENAQLRTRLALVGTPPGSMLAAPSRQSPLPPANPPSPDDTASAPAAATAPAATEPPTESAGPATTPHASSGWSRRACATIASYVCWPITSMAQG